MNETICQKYEKHFEVDEVGCLKSDARKSNDDGEI